MTTTSRQAPARARVHPLSIVSLATVSLAAAWLTTPRYGPWLGNAMAAGAIILALIVCRVTPSRAASSVRSLVVSAALGVLLAVLSWWLAPLVSRHLTTISDELRKLYTTLDRTPGPAWGTPVLVLSVAAEELVWRGVLVDWCESRWSTPRVALLATLAYCIPIVFSGTLLLVGVALALGALLTLQRLRYGSWVPCFVTHLTWNLLVFVVHPVG